MKKWIVFLAGLLLFGGVILFPSCNEEQPTTGILVIQVVDSNGFAIPEEQVFLAISLQNLTTGIYISEGWTNEQGVVFFADLLPLHYWYDTEHWEDYGGAQVWAGVEHIVTLRVTTPQP